MWKEGGGGVEHGRKGGVVVVVAVVVDIDLRQSYRLTGRLTPINNCRC